MHSTRRTDSVVYWICTGLFSAFLLLTSISYFTDPRFVQIFRHLGYPQYFRIELGAAKLIGVCLLLIPAIPRPVKEWVYAGFAIALISGAIAHWQSGDPMAYILNVVFWLGLLITSYCLWRKKAEFMALQKTG